MNNATLSALLLFVASLLQSFSFMCHKLPEQRRPPLYPQGAWPRLALNGAWMLLLGVGLYLAFGVDPRLGVIALILYFIVLPFAFQIPMARMMGFKSFRDYLATVDRGQ